MSIWGPIIGAGISAVAAHNEKQPDQQITLSPYQGAYGGQLLGTGEQAITNLQGMFSNAPDTQFQGADINTFNQDRFKSDTGNLFNMMEEMYNPQRDQQRGALESRLFSQGRLGSTGGSNEQGAFETAIERQRSQNMLQAMGQAQGIQQQQYNQELGKGQFDFGIHQGNLNNWNNQAGLFGQYGMNAFTATAPYNGITAPSGSSFYSPPEAAPMASQGAFGGGMQDENPGIGGGGGFNPQQSGGNWYGGMSATPDYNSAQEDYGFY